MKYQFGPKIANQVSVYAKIAELNDGDVEEEDSVPHICHSMMAANQRSVRPIFGSMSARTMSLASENSQNSRLKRGQATLNAVRQLSLQFTGEKFIGINWGAISTSLKSKLENDLTTVHRSLVSQSSLIPSAARTKSLHDLRQFVTENAAMVDAQCRGGYFYAETLKFLEEVIKEDRKQGKERSIRSLDFIAVEDSLKAKLEHKCSYVDQLSRTVENEKERLSNLSKFSPGLSVEGSQMHIRGQHSVKFAGDGKGEGSNSNKFSNISTNGRNSNTFYTPEEQQDFYQLAIGLRMQLDINDPKKKVQIASLLKKAEEKQLPKEAWLDFLKEELGMKTGWFKL